MLDCTVNETRKFLFYTHSFAGGGAERVWALLASEFARRGHQVIFAVDFNAPENRGYIDPQVKIIELPLGHLRATWALNRLIRTEKPDISLSAIGVSNLKHAIAALLAFRIRRSIMSFHGFFPSEPQFLSSLANRLTPVLSRLCARSIAVSDSLREALVRDHGASPARTVRIYNPVDVHDITENIDEAGLRARPPQILFAGRFNPDKDIATLLHAFSMVKTPQATLVLAGDGPSRPEIEARIPVLGLAGRVKMAGYVQDLASLYRTSRCFALSSIRESFGNVVAEALGHGLPVVSTAAAGPAEILDHGRFGAIVPIGDAAAMAIAMDEALQNPGDPAERMARAAEFSVDIAAKAYLDICEAVIREN